MAAISDAIVWGAAGQAKVLRECIEHISLRLVALFDDDSSVASPFADVDVHYGMDGFRRWLELRDTTVPTGFLVAIGGERGQTRLAIQGTLEAFGLVPLVARHPAAFIAQNASIGAGSQILTRAAVCVEAQIGRACIINTGATVDHECRLHDGVHICPGANIAGQVEIDRCATIGTGAVVLPYLRIGEGAVVGAGAVVIRDVAPYSVVVGNPARVVGMRPG